MPYSVSAGQLPSAADGNTYRVPQPDIAESKGDLGILSPKWNVFVKYIPSELREPVGRGFRKSLRARSDRGHQEKKAL